ncbi:helix-turn-helix domain-containing protein [Vibrio parahaemolyticus]|nr:helix-turn-helix domain-containing protein [Vibrio parahaemolyticus]
MLVRVSAGKNGIAEYLRDGMKSDRDQHRDQLDQRICIDGDLSLTDSLIKTMVKTDREENYYHITLSFGERDISEDKIREVYEDYKDTLMSSYQNEEFNVYAEIHIPKIKSYQDKYTGETVERFPHVHVVLPKKNLLDNKALKPFGFYKTNLKYLDAIQEKINYDHGLISPQDNQRLFRVDQSQILSRYKGDNFKGANNELKATLFDAIQEKNISTMVDFKQELANYGEVSVGKAGKPDEYLKIKPHGRSRNVRLTDQCFRPDFIERRILKREKPTQEQVNDLVDEWVNERAHEVKYIHAGSPKLRKQYQSLPKEQKRAFLDGQREQHYRRFDLSTGTRLSDRAERPVRAVKRNRTHDANSSPSRATERHGDISTRRRKSDRELSASRTTDRRVANHSNRVSGVPQHHVVTPRRQRRTGSTKLLHDHESHHLAEQQPRRSPQLRRTGDEPRRLKRFSAKRGLEKGLPKLFDTTPQGLPRASDLKSSQQPRKSSSSSKVSLPRTRRLPSRLKLHRHAAAPHHTLSAVRRLRADAQHSESYVTQLIEDHKEHKHSQDELARFRQIRQHLKAEVLLDHLSDTHGLVKDHYRHFKVKDGSVRISTGKRAYNVSDFCTQHMGMSWEETKPILKQLYGQQRQQQRVRHEQHAINSIVFVSNQVTQGWRSRSPLDESIRLLKHLQRKEQFGGLPMPLSSLERFRTPETQENAIHSGKEDFSLTETSKRIMQARETAAQLSLTMNDLVASKNEKKQYVDFSDKNTGTKLFRDTGEKLVMHSRKPDLNHTAVALTLAAEKFGTVKITGTKEFKQQVVDVAVSKDLNIVFADKAMEAEFVRRKEELKQAATVEHSAEQTKSTSTTVDENNAMEKAHVNQASSSGNETSIPDRPSTKEEVKEEPVTLVAHGQAPYQHKEGNSQSYFVELSNGETMWGVKLKDAMEESGAQIGDEVSVSKVGAKDVEVQVQKEDAQGNKLPPETIETKRNDWVVEVQRSPVDSNVQADAQTAQTTLSMSEEIKALRSAHQWSQKTLAEKVGVSSSTVGKWERGQAEPSQESIDKLEQLKGRNVAQTTTETHASDVLKPATFNVDYGWDKLSGKTSVTINGESPSKFEKTTVEQIIRKDPFLKHYSVDEVQFGLLDRSKAKTTQPVPKTYDVNANVMEEANTKQQGMKLK